MTIAKASAPLLSAFSTRFSRLVRLESADLAVLHEAEREQRRWSARCELIGEGEPIRQRLALLSGWACRQRVLADGRRQILSVLLPGDLIGVCLHRDPLSPTTVVAITDLVTCPAPLPEMSSGLAEAYARSAALEDHYMLANITRLGRLNAYERLADWLLEAQERLALAGIAATDQFPLPLTQEMLADALGLTSVHVNRTLQAMRRDGVLAFGGGTISLADRLRLEMLVDYKPARVSVDC